MYPVFTKGTRWRLLPSSHTLSQTRIITSGNHASVRGSHEETLSRPDFYRGRHKQKWKDTSRNSENVEERKKAQDNVWLKAPLETGAYLCAVKVNHERLDWLRDLGSDQELVWHHTQIDLCWIVLVVDGPGVEPHGLAGSCFHNSILCS